MRRTHRMIAVAIAATAAVVLAGATAANALTSPDKVPTRFRPPADSLGALAAPINLRIGNAVNMDKLNVDAAYTSLVANQYTTVTPENVMKWQLIEPTQGQLNFGPADQLISFAEQHGQLVRGHTLLWHNQLPDWLTTGVSNGTISNDQLRDLLKQHIFAEVGHFKGKIWQWDVANEVFHNSFDSTPALPNGMNSGDFWVSHLGPDIVADAFRWAHQADPHALLFYNDFNIAGEDGTNAKADAVYAWVKSQQAMGVPINGVGEQGHLDTQFGFSGATMQADLARYATLGKVAVTEADVRTFVETTDSLQTPTDNLALFAQPFEFDQELKACLAVRNCISFTIWDVDDADSWVPGTFKGEGYATLYDTNLNPKTAYTTLQQDLKGAVGAPRRPGFDH